MYPIWEGRRVASQWTALPSLLSPPCRGVLPGRRPRVRTPAAVPAPHSLTDQYCVGCHNQKNATAGVALNGIDFANAAGNAPILERVLRKLRTGEMPPAGHAPPGCAGSRGVHEIAGGFARPRRGRQSESRQARRPPPEPRGVQQRHPRLAGAGYSAGRHAPGGRFRLRLRQHRRRALDLPGPAGTIHVGGAHGQPPGGRGHEHQTVGGRVRRAPGRAGRPPGATATSASATIFRSIRAAALPSSITSRWMPNTSSACKVDQGGGPGRGDRKSGSSPAHRGGPADHRRDVPAGIREARNRDARRRGAAPPPPPPQAGGPAARARSPTPMAEMDLRLDGVKLKRFEVPEGDNPPQVTGHHHLRTVQHHRPGRHPQPRQDFCVPPGHRQGRGTLRPHHPRHRGPPRVSPPASPTPTSSRCSLFTRDGRDGARLRLRHREGAAGDAGFPGLPVPHRAGPAAARAPGTVYRISDLELASRLSFFLWSSIPDDQLLDLAEKGKLQDPAVLEQQVRRMLDDPRSNSLVSNFAGQWLYIRNLAQQKPDPDAFPEFDESLRQAFQHETELFFQSILREDRSVLELLDANYTFLNQRLAEHYGIPNIYGPQFRQGDADRSQPRRPAGTGQHPHGDVVSQPDVGGAARQMDSGQPAGLAAAAAAARRPGPEGEGQRRQATHHARSRWS